MDVHCIKLSTNNKQGNNMNYFTWTLVIATALVVLHIALDKLSTSGAF